MQDSVSPPGSPTQPGSLLRAAGGEQVEEICVHATAYDACMDVTGSDHKPVWPQRYRLV